MIKDLDNKDYTKTFIALKERIREAQFKSYSIVNSQMIMTYIDIGKTISCKTKEGWGSSVIKRLSIDLQSEFNGVKGLSDRNLYRMKLIYERVTLFGISPQAVAKLPWGHISLIFSKFDDREELLFISLKQVKKPGVKAFFKRKLKIMYIQDIRTFKIILLKHYHCLKKPNILCNFVMNMIYLF